MIGQKPKVSVSHRIPLGVSILLYGLAVPGDIIQVLLKFLDLTGIGIIIGEGFGWLITIAVILINSIIFLSSGDFMSGKGIVRKMIRFVLTFLAEFIPVLNFVPALTIWTWLNIRESHAEDRKRAERNATMGEARHVQIRKRRIRERIARRALEMVPMTRGAVRVYDAAQQMRTGSTTGGQTRSQRDGFSRMGNQFKQTPHRSEATQGGGRSNRAANDNVARERGAANDNTHQERTVIPKKAA